VDKDTSRKKELMKGDVARVVWFDIEGKSGWMDQETADTWIERDFNDCITYGKVEGITPFGITIMATRSPKNTEANIMDLTKIPWCNVRSFEVLRNTEDDEE